MADWSAYVNAAASIFDSVAPMLNTGWTNRSNRKIARETNAFNAQQAALNRQFQSREAQIARDWQEDQYLKYSSPSAMVSQYKEAGLNPALMYGANLQSSTGSSPSPSGSSASGVAIPAQPADLPSMVNMVMGFKRLKEEILNMRADRQVKEQEISESKSREALNAANTALQSVISDMNKAQTDEVVQRIENLKQQAKSEEQKRSLMSIQEAFYKSQKEGQDFKNALSKKFEELTGIPADPSTIGMLMLGASNILGPIVGNAVSGVREILRIFARKKTDKTKDSKGSFEFPQEDLLPGLNESWQKLLNQSNN